MTIIQLNDLLMAAIGISVTALSIKAYKYYKRAPLFDSYDLENDRLNNEKVQAANLAKREQKMEKEKARLNKRAQA